MIFPDDQLTKFRALHRYGSRPETSGGMIPSRPKKCRYTTPAHTVSLRPLVCTLKDYMSENWKCAAVSTCHRKPENALSEEEFDHGWLWQSELLTHGRLWLCRNSGCRNSGLYPSPSPTATISSISPRTSKVFCFCTGLMELKFPALIS